MDTKKKRLEKGPAPKERDVRPDPITREDFEDALRRVSRKVPKSDSKEKKD